MSKMIQIRDLDESLYGILKSRAAREGMNLSDYLKQELAEIRRLKQKGERLR